MYEFFSDTENFDPALAQRSLPGIEAIVSDYEMKINYIHFIFVDDEQLLEINRRFLDHDYYTDIITFNYAGPGKPVEGELYISIDRVRENAADLGINVEEELLRVILHGVLHLAGHDDASEVERKAMQRLENKYISVIRSTWNMNKQ
jgi:rRNA maturation RNase YbeY